jgi:hypothetical protein
MGQAGVGLACGVADDATRTVPHDYGAACRRADFSRGGGAVISCLQVMPVVTR